MPAPQQEPATASHPTPSPQEVDTGLVCLLILTRYFEIAADGGQLSHEFGLSGIPCGDTEVLHIARRLDLKAGKRSVTWARLGTLLLSAIALYTDGRYVMLGQVDGERVLVQNPREPSPLVRSRHDCEEVVSSVALPPLLEEGMLSVNFGSQPFVYKPPVGYFAFDDAMPTSERLSLLTSVPALAPGEDVAGEPLSRWIQRYWQWSRAFPKGETPADDSTDERCAAEQSGPVFFLTGNSESGTVFRTCVVPKDSYILIPLINVLAQVTPSKLADCEALMRPVGQVNASVANLYFTLNGVVLQTPISYRDDSGCFELHDVSRDIAGLASGAGYWVVLKPLDIGNHELRFGGMFRADGFIQDLRYRIQVQ